MGSDEEGAFGAQTTFYRSRWATLYTWPTVVLVLGCSSRARAHYDITIMMMDNSEQIQSESLDQVKFPSSYHATHLLTLPVVIERYAVHMLVFFFL